MKKLIYLLLIINICPLIAQSKEYSVITGVGVGTFNGDFPSQTIFGAKITLQTPSPVEIFNHLHLHFSFAQKIEKFLPGSYKYTHYSYFTDVGISGIFKQPLNNYLTLKEGIGFIYLNDRSFDDINYWNFGALINFGVETDLSANLTLNFDIDFGLTFTNTNVHYYMILANIGYRI